MLRLTMNRVTVGALGLLIVGVLLNSGEAHSANKVSEPTAEESTEAKSKFLSDMKNQLKKVEGNITELRTQATEVTGEAKTELNRQIEVLEQKRTALGESIDETSKQSGRAWAKMKSGLTKAMSELTNAYTEARNEFSSEAKKEEMKSGANSAKRTQQESKSKREVKSEVKSNSDDGSVSSKE